VQGGGLFQNTAGKKEKKRKNIENRGRDAARKKERIGGGGAKTGPGRHEKYLNTREGEEILHRVFHWKKVGVQKKNLGGKKKWGRAETSHWGKRGGVQTCPSCDGNRGRGREEIFWGLKNSN